MTRPFLLIATAVAACGPVEYVGQTSVRAQAALADARRDRADVLAPYEYTKARAYEEKARDLAGRSRFEVAIEYDRFAEDLAGKAGARARARGGRTGRAAAREGLSGAAERPANGGRESTE